MTTKERLADLLQRAERAKVLADEIAVITNSKRMTGRRLQYKHDSNHVDVLPGCLLDIIFDLGRKTLIDQKQRELAELLGEADMQLALTAPAGITPDEQSLAKTELHVRTSYAREATEASRQQADELETIT